MTPPDPLAVIEDVAKWASTYSYVHSEALDAALASLKREREEREAAFTEVENACLRAREERDRLRAALREIKNATEAAGPGEMPARWLADRARAALDGEQETGT